MRTLVAQRRLLEGPDPLCLLPFPQEPLRGTTREFPFSSHVFFYEVEILLFLFLRTVQTMHLAHKVLPERMWAPSSSPASSLAFQKLQGLLPGTQHLQPSCYFQIHPFPPSAVFWAPQAPGTSRGSTLEGGKRD